MRNFILVIMTVFILGGIPALATPEQDTIDALTALENHILGSPTITDPNVIAAHKATIDTNQALFGTDTVTNVTASGYTYDPASNVETSDTY